MNPYAIIAALLMWGGSLAGVGYWQNEAGRTAEIAKQQALDLQAEHAIDSDRHLQRQAIDAADTNHLAALATVQSKLGVANAEIQKLSGRPCLGANVVRLLNDIGAQGGEPVRAAEPAAEGAPETVASDQDVATGIAACRAGHATLSSQLNQILDIEDRRYPAMPPGH